MRNVTCTSCGKHYDYDADDFCPKCGSYNPPPGWKAQSAVSRPQAGRTQPPRAAPPARSAPPRPSVPRTTPPSSGGGFTSKVRPPQTGGRKPDGGIRTPVRPVWEDASDSSSRKRLVLVAAGLVFVLLAIIALAYALMGSELPGREPEPDTSLLTEGGFADHTPQEPFDYNGWSVTVEDAWEPELPASSAIPEGRCIAVDVWIEGGARLNGAVFATPYLLLPDGNQVDAVDGDALLSRQLKNAGVYDIVPADAQWEDPLYGQIVFFLPQDVQGTATLVLPAGAAQDAVPTLHYIDVELPALSAGPAEVDAE